MNILRTRLMNCAGLATLNAITFAEASFAQDAGTSAAEAMAIESITVTGIREDIQRAQQLKRDATGIRDVITSVELGGLPDQNLTEALQRIPGIAITRDQGEGRFVSVRGLPPELSRVTINGMTATSTDNGRAVPLDLFSSELFGTLEVNKTPSARDSAGGIGGLINLLPPDSSQIDELVATGDGAAFYSDLAGKWNSRFSGMVGNSFADGMLKLLGGVAYSHREVRQDAIFSGGWNPVGNFFDAPDDISDAYMWENGQLRMFEEDRERVGLFVNMAYEPSENQTYNLMAMHTQYDVEQIKYQFLHRFKNGSAISDVTLEGDTVVRATFEDASPGSNNQQRFENSDTTILTADASWAAGDWTVTAETGYSLAEVTVPEDLKYVWDGTATFGYDLTDPFAPDFFFIDPPGDTVYEDPSIYSKLRQVVVEERDVEDEEWRGFISTRRDLSYEVLTAVEFGVEYRDRSKYQLATLFQDRSKPKTNDGVSPLTDYNASLNVNNYFGGDYPFWNTVAVDFDLAKSGLVPAGGIEFPSDLLNSYDVSEETFAGYGMLEFESTDMSGDLGVRLIKTKTTAAGYGVLNGGAPTPVSFQGDYSEILPSANLRFDLTDDLVLRTSVSRALSRPAFEDYAPRRDVDEINFNISQGNPNLKPYTASQFDSSLEYYFSENSLIAGAFFYKDVGSFIFDQTRQVVIDDPVSLGIDAALAGQTFNVTQPVNGEGAEITGVEVIFQHTLDWLPEGLDGFGFNTNVTYTKSNAFFSANESGTFTDDETDVISQEFPLPGLSKWTVNAQLFYEKYGFTARLAYNERSKFLITPAGQEGDPEYVAAYGQLDAYIAYDVNDRISVYAEFINLTNEPLRAYTAKIPRLLEYSETGLRTFAGIRFRY